MSGSTPDASGRNDAGRRFEAYLRFEELVRGGRVQANFLPDGSFWYVTGRRGDLAIFRFDPEARSARPLFDVAAVRRAYAAHFGHEAAGSGLPFDTFTGDPATGAVTVTLENTTYLLESEPCRFSMEARPNAIDEFTGTSARARTTPRTFVRPHYFVDSPPVPELLSPDGSRFASLRDGNVAVRSTADGRYDLLTNDAEPDHGWDVESMRLAVASGLRVKYRTTSPWAPDGLHLYATRFDTRSVGRISRIRYLRQFDEVESFPLTRAGDALPCIEPYVLNVLDRSRVRLALDTRDCFLLLLGWSEDASQVRLFRIGRDMAQADVLVADARTGATRIVLTERSDTFLRIQHDVIGGRSGCFVLPGDRGFIWESDRDGWRHFYHYDWSGALVRRLTHGPWPVVDPLWFDAAGGWLYFEAHPDTRRPYDVHLCRVRLDGGDVERLTDGPGMHDAQLSPDGRYYVDTIQAPAEPPRSVVRTVEGEVVHAFEPMDTSALASVGWTPPEQARATAADGATELWAVIYKPADFDARRRYPVIECIYGGPQVSVACHGFATGGSKMGALNLALPQLGYVVVVVDARGTPERSKAFQDATYKEWRRHVTQDHAAALRSLAAERPWMDLTRVGIWGHSWGGYFTVANLLDNPDLYRAGVASAPGLDPYDMFLSEPYLGGVPSSTTKAAYDDAVLMRDASRLRGALLIAAGSNDVAVWHDSVRMTNALIEAGKDHEFVMLPNQHHGYGAAAESYFVRKLVEFFERHVKAADGRTPATTGS